MSARNKNGDSERSGSALTESRLFAPKIADATIPYSHKVLKTFNHHLTSIM